MSLSNQQDNVEILEMLGFDVIERNERWESILLVRGQFEATDLAEVELDGRVNGQDISNFIMQLEEAERVTA